MAVVVVVVAVVAVVRALLGLKRPWGRVVHNCSHTLLLVRGPRRRKFAGCDCSCGFGLAWPR